MAEPFQGISERGCGVAIYMGLRGHSEVSGELRVSVLTCPFSWQPPLGALWTALRTLALVH